MKILFTADWHIKLGQAKVPRDWQANRYHALVDTLNAVECDLMIIGGDIFDTCKPTGDELELYFELVRKIEHKTLIYTGNHEMTSKKKHYLTHLKNATSYVNTKVSITGSVRTPDFDIIDYVELHSKEWEPQKSKLCFTHVRGEIPPHVTPEIDLDKFSQYELVISGDLHSHTCSQKNIMYPGSPFSTTFHRKVPKGDNGYIIVDANTLEWVWYELELPQLVRKTITDPKDMVKTDYHHTIYEIEGDIAELANISTDSELFDKKVNNSVTSVATLNLNGNTVEELSVFLNEVQGLDDSSIDRIINRFNERYTDDRD